MTTEAGTDLNTGIRTKNDLNRYKNQNGIETMFVNGESKMKTKM